LIKLGTLDPSFDALAQSLHVTLGMLFVLIPAYKWPMGGWAVGLGAGILWAAVKEGIWDNLIESPAVRGSGWRDFGFYMVGIVVGFLVYSF
jgi:hypothetical protein